MKQIEQSRNKKGEMNFIAIAFFCVPPNIGWFTSLMMSIRRSYYMLYAETIEVVENSKKDRY